MAGQLIQYISSLVAMMGMICCGLHMGWSSPNLPKMLDGSAGFTIIRPEASWIASLFLLGSLPSTVLTKFIVDRIGRKSVLLMSAWPYILAWVIILLAKEAWHVYCAQLSAGLALGFGLGVTSMYTAEIAEKHIRGALVAVVNFGMNIGSLFSLVIGPYISYQQVACVSIVIPILFFIICLWLPESPYYHLMKGQRDKAEKELMRLRREVKPAGVLEELNLMELNVKDDMARRGTFKELFCEGKYNRTILIIWGVRSLQQLCGNMAVVSYMQIIVDASGANISGSTFAIIYGVVQVSSGVLATVLTDRLGRKPLLYFSSVGHSLSLTAIGAYFFMQDYLRMDVAVLSSISWIPIASIMLFCVCYSVGVGSLGYVLMAEYFPTNVKSIAVSVSSFYGCSLAFLVSKVYLEIADAAGIYTAFWIFALFSYAGIAFTHFLVPETKNKTFAEIQDILNNSAKVEPKTYNGTTKNDEIRLSHL